ncbi:MAG: tetratricopeptide repeat protein [bacterium]|nr:tetratricopeptide repeat protein [bacterium]
MKIPPRILAPIVLAVSCTAVLMIFLWWQLTQSTALIRTASHRETPQETTVETEELTGPIDPRDRALFHLRQGDLLALRGQWDEAESEYEQAVKANGGLPALRKLAQAQLQRRDISGVRSTLRKLKKEGARSEDLLLLESIVALRTGELVDARKLLENAEDSPQKQYGLALLSIIEGSHIQAQEQLDLVVGGWEPVLRSHARTLQAAYQEFSLFPESSNVHLITLLSRGLAQVQECELALPLLIQVTQVKDDYRDAWIIQGYCEVTTERPEQALASLEHAYNLDPQKPEIQFFLARSYADLGDHNNAITFFEYALTNGFEPAAEVYRLIAQEALLSGNADLALKQYEALTQDSKATIESYEGYVNASITLDRKEDAYIIAKQAVDRWPENASAYDLLGWASLESGKKAEAVQALTRALEINPYLMSAKERLRTIQ